MYLAGYRCARDISGTVVGKLLRVSQDGHARRNKTWSGAITTPRRSRLANVRLVSIDTQADDHAEPTSIEKGAIAAYSATPEQETPAKKGQKHLVSVECEH